MLKYIFVHVHKSISLIGKLIDNSGELRQCECFGAGICPNFGLLKCVCHFLLRHMQRIENGIDGRFASLCERGADNAEEKRFVMHVYGRFFADAQPDDSEPAPLCRP